ncbi:hypothetical protein RYX36_015645 [Vicia faba]
MLIQQNNVVDPSHINGLYVASGSQPVEKGDQITQMIQGQTSYPGSGLDPSQPPKPPGSAHPSNNCQLQQKNCDCKIHVMYTTAAHAAAASGLLGHTELRLHMPPSITLASRGRLQGLRLQLTLLDREFDDLD